MSLKHNRALIIGTLVLALAVLFTALSAGFPHYSAALRKAGLYVSSALSFILSFLPFALSEILLLLALPAVVTVFVIKMRKYGAAKGAARAAKGVFCALCAAALLFSVNLGVHYGAPALSDSLGLYVGRYTSAQLAELADALLEQANHFAALAPRNAEGECDFGAFGAQAKSAMDAFAALARDTGAGFDFSVFNTPRTAAPKKAPLLSVAMSYLGIAGVYIPFTAECIVSIDTVDVELPFTIAHEAAHGHGIAAEDEANFAAFLACSRSADARLNYSAYFNAYIYASNALYAADYDAWLANAQSRSEFLTRDLAQLNEHLAKYQTPIRDAGEAVNDAFIKATGQPEGLQTYGKVVDLLLAWHFAGAVFGE